MLKLIPFSLVFYSSALSMGTTLSDDFIIGFGCCSCDFVSNRKSQIRIHFDSKHKSEQTDNSSFNIDHIKEKMTSALSNKKSEPIASHSLSNGNDVPDGANTTSNVNQSRTKRDDKQVNAFKVSTKFSTYEIREYVESHPSITLADVDNKNIQSKTIISLNL